MFYMYSGPEAKKFSASTIIIDTLPYYGSDEKNTTISKTNKTSVQFINSSKHNEQINVFFDEKLNGVKIQSAILWHRPKVNGTINDDWDFST